MIAKELSDLLWRAIALAAGPPCPECGWYSGEHKTTVQHLGEQK